MRALVCVRLLNSLEENQISMETRFELLRWEQAAPGRALKVGAKKELPNLLKAQANDASVTSINLNSSSLGPECGAWLAQVLESNTFVTKIRFVSKLQKLGFRDSNFPPTPG